MLIASTPNTLAPTRPRGTRRHCPSARRRPTRRGAAPRSECGRHSKSIMGHARTRPRCERLCKHSHLSDDLFSGNLFRAFASSWNNNSCCENLPTTTNERTCSTLYSINLSTERRKALVPRAPVVATSSCALLCNAYRTTTTTTTTTTLTTTTT